MEPCRDQFIAILRVFSFYHKPTQRAIQWWFHQQTKQTFELGELIREGLLQETFALRRQLEFLQAQQAEESSTRFIKQELQELEQIYRQLEQVADQLAPFYLEHRWPLAIKQAMQRLGRDGKGLQISLVLPVNWDYQPPQQDQLFLKFLAELLMMAASKDPDSSLIELKLENRQMIKVKINYRNLATRKVVSDSEEIRHLRLAFNFLTKGKINQQVCKSQVIYSLSW